MEIFIAYSREDESSLNSLRTHLKALQRSYPEVQILYDGEIPPGSEWKRAIKEMISTADIFIPLVSVNFIASDYCFDSELQDAYNEYETRKAIILPLIIGHCQWKNTILGKFQGFPRNAEPISNTDKELNNFIEEIKKIIFNKKNATKLSKSEKSLEKWVKFPQYCYFTLLDTISQDAMVGDHHEKYKRISQNLKISLLIQEKVIFRATTVLKSIITSQILFEARAFIEAGILVPEFREFEFLLKEMKIKNSTEFKNVENLCEIIDYQKEKAGKIVDGKALGDARTNLLIDNLFRLQFWQEKGEHIPFLSDKATINNFDSYFSMLTDGIPDRANEIMNPLRGFFIAVYSHFADALMQAIYFGVGASYVSKGQESKIANAFWSVDFDPLTHLRLWTTNFPKLRDLSVEQFSLAKKFSITDRLEEREEILGKSYTDYGNILTHGLDIPEEWLDLLTWEDVWDLRHSKEGEDFRKFLLSLEISQKETGELGLRQLFNNLLRNKFNESKRQIKVREYEREDNEYNPAADIHFLRANPEYSTLAFSELIKSRMYNTG